MLETDRLVLREFVADDFAAMDELFRDPAVMRFSLPSRLLPTADWIERCRQSYRTLGYGRWAVVSKSTRRAIGFCGLAPELDDRGRHEVEIGYRLASSEWGRGLATEAATAVRDIAFHTLGLRRLVAFIDPDNIASQRVAEKIGMQFEREIRLEGYDHPDRLYAIHRVVK